MTDAVRAWDHFAAIDWSGAAGERQAGIALALCDADGGPPRLVRPGRRWSRTEALDWLLRQMPANTLVGLDLGMSLPFVDCGAFFPGWEETPADARELWTLVERISAADPHLGAGSFVDHPQASRFFRRHGGREGERFHAPGAAHKQGRFRLTELAQGAMACRPYSNFNLVGAAQVGKSSLTGMRLLHRLAGQIPVWPVDSLPATGSVVVEIYTAIAALEAGRRPGRAKIRTRGELDHALGALGSPPWRGRGPVNDHRTDALLTAAWLRRAAGRGELWHPPALTPALARTEGWTFGAT